MGNIMRITRRCTLISLSAIVSRNRLNPRMQRAKIDMSVWRALSVYDNVVWSHPESGRMNKTDFSSLSDVCWNLHQLCRSDSPENEANLLSIRFSWVSCPISVCTSPQKMFCRRFCHLAGRANAQHDVNNDQLSVICQICSCFIHLSSCVSCHYQCHSVAFSVVQSST